MNLEGKFWGYKKTTLALAALLLVVAGVMFYAGAKYEKRKLTSLKAVKTTSAVSGKAKKTSTSKSNTVSPAADQNQDTTNSGATSSDTSGDATSGDLQN